MQIKTPVQFGPFDTLEDADGQVFLELDPGTTPGLDTKQAIIDTFEDAARFRFVMAAADNEDGPERQMMNQLGQNMMEDDQTGSVQMRELIDAARARFAQ